MNYLDVYNNWISSSSLNDEERQQLKEMSEEDIYECFYRDLEFGTAGMRGKMGLGSNRINRFTIRMAASGMAHYLGKGARVAVAYDTRNNSQAFAQETARVLAAAGLQVYLFEDYSPVPLLSYAIRKLGCDGGVVITASHNTKEYNGFKVYDRTGCQMLPDEAAQVAAGIAALEDPLQVPTAELDDPLITLIGEDIIASFMEDSICCGAPAGYSKEELAAEAKALKIVYTPIHGSGRDYVLRILKEAGFEQIETVPEQMDYNGDFPTVAKPNPEEKAALFLAAEKARETGADIIIGTDPDCDRIGVGIPDGDDIVYLTGNQTGELLIDYLSRINNGAGKTLITTIVSGQMGEQIARERGIRTCRTLTGFKYIGELMNRFEKEGKGFFMGYEESYGYLTGMHARDKDGVSTALVICRMAAWHKARGRKLTEELNGLYEEHGFWVDSQESLYFEGSQGEGIMKDLMEELYSWQEQVFDGLNGEDGEVVFTDYRKGIDDLPPENVMRYGFEDGSWIVVRPSGTEPKIKIYYCIQGNTREEAKAKTEKYSGLLNEEIEKQTKGR